MLISYRIIISSLAFMLLTSTYGFIVTQKLRNGRRMTSKLIDISSKLTELVGVPIEKGGNEKCPFCRAEYISEQAEKALAILRGARP